MKKKYLVPAAAAAAALVLLAAALLWYGRSRSFRAVFPLSGSVEVSCRAQWTPEEGQGYARDLTGEQTSQVLGALKEQQLRRRYGDLLPWGGEGPVTSSMGESLLLTFRDRSGVSCELLFLGDRMWLHDLERDWGASYSLSGGQVFQEELTGVVYELVHPKAETVGTVYADLDGDGSDETVRLCAEETVEPDESGVPLVTDEAALRPYRLETEVDGRAAACALGDAGERYEGVARLFVTADRAGAPVIAYVPLDDRPDNAERVVYLAESLGYELAMPERDLYRTRLDGQPPNENGTQYGDRGALYEWVAKQEAAGCDRYILSLDQLLSGGLVSSRAMTGENPVTLSSGETLVEAELLTAVIDLLAADENNRIWLLDTVMRLAATTGYGGFGLNEYNALRTYGMAPRPHLEGTGLTIGNIVADYPLGADGTPVPVEAEEPLPEGAVENYLASRERKLRLSDAMFQALEETADGQFRVLIGIDDSSEEDSIQKNEIAYLRAQLRQGDALLSGVDDLAFKAVTKLCLEEYGWEGATVSVQYFGGTEDQPACAYDYQPLEAIVAEHFDFFDLTMAEPGGEELAMLVLTQPADPAAQETYINALVQCLNDNRAAGLPTILIDAGNGTYGTAFHKALTDQAELGWLLSYAGFLDMAIVTGTALSHGVARYAFLQHGEQTDATEQAFLRTLADSILKDFCYKNIVRNDILSFVRNDLSGNADNFWMPDIDRVSILERLEAGMAVAVAPVIENLERSNFISSLSSTREYAERGWGGVELTGYSFPWDRAFEISMEIRLGAFTEPHKALLGIYYK